MLNKIKNLLHLKRLNKNIKEDFLSFEDRLNAMYDSLKLEELNIYLGEDLVPFAEEICEGIWELREGVKEKTGLILPAVRIRDYSRLQENEFEICIREKTLVTCFTIPEKEYAKNDILYNLELVCKENLEQIFSNRIVERYINTVQEENAWLVWEMSRYFGVLEIKSILLGLINQGYAINDIAFLFEKITEHCGIKNTARIVNNIKEYCRPFDWEIETKNEKTPIFLI